MNLEFNKIFAAVLVAGITAGFAGFVASHVIHPHELHENAFKIEGVETAGAGATAEAKPEPILDLIATADPAKGQQIAEVCASCHNFTKGGPNMIGPDLWGVVGRDKGSHEGFDYSATLKALEGGWSYADLNHFLWNPKKFAPGTKMNFIGVKKPADRAAVIAWLRTLDDAPHAMPTPDEIATDQAALAPAADAAAAKPGNVTAPATSEIGEPDAEVSGKGETEAVEGGAARDEKGMPADGKPAAGNATSEGEPKPVNPVTGSVGAGAADDHEGGTEGSKADAKIVPGTKADEAKVTTEEVDGGTPEHEKDDKSSVGDHLVP